MNLFFMSCFPHRALSAGHSLSGSQTEIPYHSSALKRWTGRDKHLGIATESCVQIEFPLSNLEACLYPKASGILTCPWKNFLCLMQWPHACAASAILMQVCACAAGHVLACALVCFLNTRLLRVLWTCVSFSTVCAGNWQNSFQVFPRTLFYIYVSTNNMF